MSGTAKGFVFQRIEKKYLLHTDQYDRFLKAIERFMKLDEYGLSTICNIYFDTEKDELIRTSIERPPYKEKLRLRSYGVPQQNDKVYLEIKKKYDSIVYKRRISLTLQEAEDYLLRGIHPAKDSQILREIDYFMKFYSPVPKLYLAYDRMAYFGREDKDFRMTFDSGIRSRREDLYLGHGDYGTQLYDEEYYLLEIKAAGAYPLWLAKSLSELEIYPISFSKYGSIYKQEVVQRMQSTETQYEENTAFQVDTVPDRSTDKKEIEGDTKICLPV